MKVLIVGGHGTIGRKVSQALSMDHEVLIAGRTEGYYSMDIADSKSISDFFKKIGNVDAIINIAGDAKWAPFSDLSEEDYYVGIKSKLMGQVNLVRIGTRYLNEGGCIILSTGILADKPVPMTASAAMVNGGIHSFARAASLEIKNNHRINVVSLGLVQDSAEKYGDYFPGHTPITMDEAVHTYRSALLSEESGKIFECYA